jgi:hypothetical protein
MTGTKMENSFPDPISDGDRGAGKSTRITGAVIAVLAVALVAFFFLRSSSRQDPSGSPGSPGTLTPEARAYLSSLAVEHLDVSRAENFLHQEVTTITGEVVNAGNRSVASATVTVEFFDQLNQVAQRETHLVLAPPAPPIAPGGRREFEISLDHVSSEWNMAPPVVKVTVVSLNP